MVIISHWFRTSSFATFVIPLGPIGVDIFFTLSGFLITLILLEGWVTSGKSDISKTLILKNFYARRVLRIFPIYYLTVILIFVFKIYFNQYRRIDIPPNIWTFLTYTQNFYIFKTQAGGILAHLWSLAVEEQFYLIWPFIILFTKRKYLLLVIILFILIGVTSQYIMRNELLYNMLTFTCFDSFGLGGILAWQITYKSDALNKFFLALSILSIASIAFIFLVFLYSLKIPIRTETSIISLWAIAYIYMNSEKNSMKLGWLLNNRVLVFLGKISYGLYIYHYIIPQLLNDTFLNIYLNPHLPDFLFKRNWDTLYFIENIILLIVIAWLSYVLVEKPFLRLKKYFETKEKSKASLKFSQLF